MIENSDLNTPLHGDATWRYSSAGTSAKLVTRPGETHATLAVAADATRVYTAPSCSNALQERKQIVVDLIISYSQRMKVAAYQAPLLTVGSMDALGLICTIR